MQLAMPQNQKAKTRRPSVVSKEEHVGSQFFPQPTAMFFFYLRISRTAELSEIPVAASETGQWFMIYLLAAAGAWASFLLRRTGRQSGEGKEPAIVVPESWQEFQTTRVIQTLPVNAGRRRVLKTMGPRCSHMQILHCVDRYLANRTGNVKKLKPPFTGFRLRCGDHRVFFDQREREHRDHRCA